MAGSLFGLLLLIVVLSLALSDNFRTEDEARSLLSSASLSGLLMLILGVVAGAGEYRHGTIASTLLVTPDRLRAVAAQTLAVAALVAAIGVPWLSAKDAPMLSTGELLGMFLGCALYTALAAALGVALGALMRNQVAAVVLVLVFLFVIDPVITAVAEGYAKFSLTGLGTSMSGGSAEDVQGSDLLPFGVAALIWAAYTVALAVAASVLTTRRDI